ncbi:four-helix bundle copper-binding protein [Methylocystis bryophila]|uniref:Four-helix bundle copper-binding protein n=1 Tax=Methylocystis bryophila TaxID=655015 RepID=A0A1W6MXX0_9HYPH|nr:four-helix bundle copper-binding protein [Methylocystis bryophila]ARN82424.1 four-helix bundle copper-binding protein [Methylocystis bryophila]
MHLQSMIAARPKLQGAENEALARCIEKCFDCAETCFACAGACLDEEELKGLRECIRLNLDCADICDATGAIGARRGNADTSSMRTMLRACAEACRLCAVECESHAGHHEHCRICAEVCRACEAACNEAAPGSH